MIVDVTEQRRAHTALRQAKEAAEEASKARRAFLANISHEIRTPVNGISGFADLLKGTELSAKQRDYLDALGDCAQFLVSLLNDVLDFSKIDASQLQIETIGFSLRETLDNIIRSFGPATKEKNLALAQDVSPEVPNEFLGDPTRLRQILTNLISNAIKFTEKGGVQLRVEQLTRSSASAELRFSVSDTGIGIPLDTQKTIFEAFTQADVSTTRKYGGTGLGLTIASRLIELMGGGIQIASKEGEGSVFYFDLCLKQAAT